MHCGLVIRRLPSRARPLGAPGIHEPCALGRAALGLLVLASAPASAWADDLFVGGPSDAFASVQAALDAATPRDRVVVRAGSYDESLTTSGPGVTLIAAGDGTVTVTHAGRVLRVRHPDFRVEGITLDGQYGDRDAVRIDDGADGFTMSGVEVRRSGRDCVDMGSVSDVTIESSHIHHCLSSSAPDCASDACRDDAHGVVGAAVQRLVIRDTEIDTFSGDALQLDPGRSAPGWTDVTIEGCRLWTGPLARAQGGFAAGVVPGENAVDTKTHNDASRRARLTILDTEAHGFRGGLITNMAAFNLKEDVEVLLDRVSVWDSQIALRLRGATSSRPRGARVTIRNAVVWDVDTAIRYEDDIEVIHLDSSTLGADVDRFFDDQSRAGMFDAHNVLVLAPALPAEAMGPGSLAVDGAAFVDAAGHDHHLADGSPAIDTGAARTAVTVDRDGHSRPQGAGWDVGAYERCGVPCVDVDGGLGSGADGGAATPGDAGGPGRGDAGGARADGGGDGEGDAGCGCVAAGATRSGRRAPGWLLAALAALWLARRGR